MSDHELDQFARQLVARLEYILDVQDHGGSVPADSLRRSVRARRDRQYRANRRRQPAPPRLQPSDQPAATGWRSRAACLHRFDVDWLAGDHALPKQDGYSARNAVLVEQAKAVCSECPVMDDCLLWALQTAAVGVYGSTTTRERRRMSRENWPSR